MTPAMTLSREAFEMIGLAFNLHPASLSAFFHHGGPFSIFYKRDRRTAEITHIQMVIKVVQKVEVCNCLLSLCYDLKTGWTDAFFCGEGMIRSFVPGVSTQASQITNAILGVPHLWTNPLLLPTILLQICFPGTEYVALRTEENLIELEEELGVTEAGQSQPDKLPQGWPIGIDVKEATKDLHSLMPQVLFMENVTLWQQRYAKFLLATESQLRKMLPMTLPNQLGFSEIREELEFASSITDAMVGFFALCKGRVSLQINVLFSIISQKDAIVNTAISNSTKRDSISMTTFTFITAMFLPGSFVATLFGMSMFNWQSAESHVTSDFWIFWAVAIPLTIMTLVGWYLWFLYASKSWNRSMRMLKWSNEEDKKHLRLVTESYQKSSS